VDLAHKTKAQPAVKKDAGKKDTAKKDTAKKDTTKKDTAKKDTTKKDDKPKKDDKAKKDDKGKKEASSKKEDKSKSAQKDTKQKDDKTKGKKDTKVKRIEETIKTELSKHAKAKFTKRNSTRTIDPALVDQFKTGRVYAKISSRPGQCGRCDGYILEGEELAFYIKKLNLKKKK